MINRKLIFAFILSCVYMSVLSQNTDTDTTDWSRPENINPFDNEHKLHNKST